MKRHVTAASIIAAAEAYNSLCRLEIAGTGHSVVELLRLGYDRLWLTQVVPWNWVNVALALAFVVLWIRLRNSQVTDEEQERC